MKQKIYSLHGVFFQANLRLALGHKPGIGTAVKIVPTNEYTMFHALVGPDEFLRERFSGIMQDRYSESAIKDLMLTETSLEFTKFYRNRPGIEYQFSKNQAGIWVGTWNGADCGSGEAKCTLVELDQDFIIPESFLTKTEE